MAEKEPMNNQPDETPSNDLPPEPLIPPQYLLALGFVGLFVALIVLFTQPTFGVVGFGGLGLGLLSFIAWALMAPQQAAAILTGRTAKFGGVSVIVTVVVIVMLVVVYIFVRNQNWRTDLTESDQFSLTEESRSAMTAIGADPNIPRIKMIVFLAASNAAARDQNSLLMNDYVDASAGKITYEFVDTDRNPNLAGLYGVTRSGQVAVVAETDAPDPATDPAEAEAAQTLVMADGFRPDVDNAELVNTTLQQDLTNAILKVAASGAFNTYFLTVQDNASAEMSTLKQNLEERFDWVVEDISLAELTSPGGEFTLNDANLDGEVIVIPGGSTPLAPEEIEILQTYLNNGGDLVIFAGTNLNADAISLATDTALNDMLFANFGIRMNNDLIIDETQAFQSPLLPVSIAFDRTSFITTNGVNPSQPVAVFEAPHSITISDTPPANVTTTALMRSSAQAYARSDIATLLTEEEIARPEDVESQAYILAASAENTATGAKVILIGSTSLARDTYSVLNVDNLSVAFNSLIWATNYDSFFTQITVQQQQRPQDAPLFADQQTVRNISFVTIVLIPFGILAIGAYVWWSNRERRSA